LSSGIYLQSMNIEKKMEHYLEQWDLLKAHRVTGERLPLPFSFGGMISHVPEIYTLKVHLLCEM